MALAFVNRAQGGSTASSTTLASPAISHTTGNLLIVMIETNGGMGVTNITDTASNTYTAVGSEFNNGSNWYQIYYSENITGNASNVVTVTFSAARIYRAIVVYQVSGAATSSVLNTSKTASGTGTAIDSGTFALVASEEIVVMLLSFDATIATITGGTGFTLTNFAITGDANPYYADEYKIVTVDTAATATLSTSAGWAGIAASFKVAGQNLSPKRLSLLGVGT